MITEYMISCRLDWMDRKEVNYSRKLVTHHQISWRSDLRLWNIATLTFWQLWL